jgi:hypothetical protein
MPNVRGELRAGSAITRELRELMAEAMRPQTTARPWIQNPNYRHLDLLKLRQHLFGEADH